MSYFKVNFDEAMFDDTNEARIRVVIWNSPGEVMASLFKKILKPSSVTALELLAARLAVLFAWEIDLHQIVLEGDLEFVISSLKSGTNLGSMYGPVIRDVLSFVNSFQSVSFSHSYRQGNVVADALIKRARLSFQLLVWMKSVPSNVVHFVLADFPA